MFANGFMVTGFESNQLSRCSLPYCCPVGRISSLCLGSLLFTIAPTLLQIWPCEDKHGCWFVQQALQQVPSELQEMIQSELKGKILVCSQHLHGNFVLQKCVELLPGSISFIIKELKNHVVDAAAHVYSCRVLQRLVEHCKHDRPDMAGLFDILLRPENLQKLVMDSYGNNVVRAVLACGNRHHVQRIVRIFLLEEADLMAYARNRHGSLVLERCLESLNDAQKELVPERNALMALILGTDDASLFSQIALDRFGNYIVQRTIEICEGPEQQRVQELLNSLSHKLRRSVNGRHILQAARKKFGLTLSVTAEDLVWSASVGFKVHRCTCHGLWSRELCSNSHLNTLAHNAHRSQNVHRQCIECMDLYSWIC